MVKVIRKDGKITVQHNAEEDHSIKEESIVKNKAVKARPEKETLESKLVKLLSGKEFYTVKDIVAKVGYAEASARMYVNPEYLKRKEKPYKVIVGKKGKEEAYRYEVKNAKK